MNSSEITNSSKQSIFFKNKKIIYILIALIILIILVLIILLTRPTNQIESNINNSTNESSNQINEDALTFLPSEVCPDSISFSPSLLAKLNNKNYLVGGDTLSWIQTNCPNTVDKSKSQETNTQTKLPWTFNGTTWISNGNVPNCSNPLEITTPVDMSKVSGMLYPGQVRGSDYKPHGGFAFDEQTNNQVTVKLPDDSLLWRASRYIQNGEVQYLADFLSDCGIAYRFDHLLTLSDKLMQEMNKLPEPNESTFTTFINPAVEFMKGEVIATEVGFRNPLNVGFDLGVYDLRSKNSVSQNNQTWAAAHQDEAEYAFYAICWLDNLSGNDKVTARSLKARGAYGNEGKESDYCD